MGGVTLLVVASVFVAIGLLAIANDLFDDKEPSKPFRPLKQVVEDVCLQTVRDYFETPEFKALVLKEARKDPRFSWLVAMARHFRSVDPTMKPEDAYSLAVDTTNEYLRDEKLKFGDPDYAWDAHAAGEIADEWKIRYWEAKT